MKRAFQAIAVLFLTASTLCAQSSALLNYQGRLIGTNGLPVNGLVDVVINVYSQSVGGSPVYSESMGNVVVQDGLYSFNWGVAGTSPVSRVENVAIANGSQSVFNFTVGLPPVKNGSVTITGGAFTWKDDGSGSSSPANFLGSVSSYSAGNMSAIFLSGAPASGTVVSVRYVSPQVGFSSAITEQYIEVVLDGLPLEPRARITAVPLASRAISANENDPIWISERDNYFNKAANAITVSGVVQSLTGGFKFPDGSVQITSAYKAETNELLITSYLGESSGKYFTGPSVGDQANTYGLTYYAPISIPDGSHLLEVFGQAFDTCYAAQDGGAGFQERGAVIASFIRRGTNLVSETLGQYTTSAQYTGGFTNFSFAITNGSPIDVSKYAYFLQVVFWSANSYGSCGAGTLQLRHAYLRYWK
ncbi:MAG TPA: hypothetical protein PKE17_18970 [Saprospiraceae bacterium]|nr:hypothetical protein [Saprospiraceae bacterium]